MNLPEVVSPWGDAAKNIKGVFDTMAEAKKEEIKAKRQAMSEAVKEAIREEREKEKEKRDEEREKRKEERQYTHEAVRDLAREKRDEAKREQAIGDARLGEFIGLLKTDLRKALVHGYLNRVAINRAAPGFDPTAYVGDDAEDIISATNEAMGIFESFKLSFRKDADGKAEIANEDFNAESYDNNQKLLRLITVSAKAGPPLKDIHRWALRTYGDIYLKRTGQKSESVRVKKPLEKVQDKIQRGESLTQGDFKIAKEYARKQAELTLKSVEDFKEADAATRKEMINREMVRILDTMGAYVAKPDAMPKERVEKELSKKEQGKKEVKEPMAPVGMIYNPQTGKLEPKR